MTDKEIIEKLGGSSKVAALLQLGGRFPQIRVNQWKTRGIPAKIKLQYPHIFLRKEYKNCAI
jgi:hypothetical protein